MPVVTKTWSIRSLPEMDGEQFQLWRTLLEDRTGIVVSDERKSFLETSLGIRMREVDCYDYDQFYEQLFSSTSGLAAMEWSVLVDRLTVQETSFFRHRSSYELLDEHLSEQLTLRESGDTISIWSVGCSSGEEPYSIAMLVNELLEANRNQIYFGITATDISAVVLDKAREGIYFERRLDLLDPMLREKYFSEVAKGQHQVLTALRERICFARLNVLELNNAPMGDMDIIFCQNMLIYFRRWRKRDVVNRLAERLAPGGLLVLGIGEITDWEHPELERVDFNNTLAYRKVR